MSKIKIETITAVHIGSGEFLQFGNDFVDGLDSKGFQVVSIIDPDKVMGLIGEDRIQDWVAAIEKRESTADVVKRFSPKSKLEDFSKRIIDIEYGTVIHSTDTLKEFIHNGMGKPYIPGSSIKGAIRTAVLASLAQDSQQPIKNKKGVIDATPTETYYFGKDPNNDVFRFLQVGDAHFGKNYELVVRMVNLNERHKKSFWDESKSQLIEVLGANDESCLNLSINNSLINFTREKVHTVPDCFADIKNLFKTINNHTKKLLLREIEYWQERIHDDFSGKSSVYITKINEILETIPCNDNNSCVLRIGHGSGWRFITGAWTENRQDFYDEIVPRARKHDREKYSHYDFPKSRRVDSNCDLLGFVKLTIIE